MLIGRLASRLRGDSPTIDAKEKAAGEQKDKGEPKDKGEAGGGKGGFSLIGTIGSLGSAGIKGSFEGIGKLGGLLVGSAGSGEENEEKIIDKEEKEAEEAKGEKGEHGEHGEHEEQGEKETQKEEIGENNTTQPPQSPGFLARGFSVVKKYKEEKTEQMLALIAERMEKRRQRRERAFKMMANLMTGTVANLLNSHIGDMTIQNVLKDLREIEKDDTWHSYLEKVPSWAEKPLQDFEHEVGICFAAADEEFGNKVLSDLEDLGFKCTKDPSHMSNTRAFVLIFSEDAASDETVLRLLTRAAERFNDGNTNIFPLVHPKCVTTVLNQIPHTLAYSLSNTTFVNTIPSPSLAANPQFVISYYEKKILTLARRLEGYVQQNPRWDVSGVWVLRVVIKMPGSAMYDLKEFTAFLQHKDATTITGTTVNGIEIEGKLDGNSLKLQLKFNGQWKQASERWDDPNFIFIAQINAGLKVQGTKFEGSYVDSFCGIHRSGTVSAVLEEECLSGYYNFVIAGQPQKISLIQRGDKIFGDMSGMHGTLFSGVISKDSAFWVYSVGDLSGTYNGTITDQYINGKKQSSIKGSAYLKNGSAMQLVSFTATQMDPIASPSRFHVGVNMFRKLSLGAIGKTVDYSLCVGKVFTNTKTGKLVSRLAMPGINGIKKVGSLLNFEYYDRQAELEEAYAKKFNIDTTRFTPLEEGEFGVFIGSADDCREQANALRDNLIKLGIPGVTLDISDHPKARTFIVLLSAETKHNPALVQATFETAVSNKPIFNIGLSDFFAIFDETKWTDKEALRNLRDALARLNQTDATTLDPTNNNFAALVRRIKGHVEAPSFRVVGLWYIQFPDSPELSFMLFVKQQTEDSLEATEISGAQWHGSVQSDTLTLKKFEEGQYTDSIFARLKEKGSTFIGRYVTEEAAHNVLGTLETDGISGLWELDNEAIPIGIVQKGGGRLIIQHEDRIYPGVMTGNLAISQMHTKQDPNEKATYEAVVRNSKHGLVMSGHFYTETLTNGPFIARRAKIEQRDDSAYDVMISYRSTDARFVNMLQQVLEEAGISCWRDRRMEVGTNWSEDITRAVRTSRCILCCISDNYIKSSLCTKEILMAHDMGKIIIPLVLPHSEAKVSDFLKLVRAAYPSKHPPHVVAREIAKTTWFDFRPFSEGPDPTDASLFETRYPIINQLKLQLNNIKRKGWLWQLEGKWLIICEQDPTENSANLRNFEAIITFAHTKYSLTGTGKLSGSEIEELTVTSEGRLDNSVLFLALKFPPNPSDTENTMRDSVLFVTAMLGIDGSSFSGKFSAYKVGAWCSQFGGVRGKAI